MGWGGVTFYGTCVEELRRWYSDVVKVSGNINQRRGVRPRLVIAWELRISSHRIVLNRTSTMQQCDGEFLIPLRAR